MRGFAPTPVYLTLAICAAAVAFIPALLDGGARLTEAVLRYIHILYLTASVTMFLAGTLLFLTPFYSSSRAAPALRRSTPGIIVWWIHVKSVFLVLTLAMVCLLVWRYIPEPPSDLDKITGDQPGLNQGLPNPAPISESPPRAS